MTPEAIEKAEFPPALRGYDKQQVRSYLVRLGREYAALEKKLADAQAKIAELPPTKPPTTDTPAPPKTKPVNLGDTGDQMSADQFDKFGLQIAGLLRDARDSASQTKSQADLESQALLEQTRSDSKQKLAAAEAEANRIISEANNQTEKANLEAKARIEAAQSEAHLIKSTVEAEIADQQRKCEIETKERYEAADKLLADKQVEADELWNSAEAEAYKVREASRAESVEIEQLAEKQRSTAIASVEAETEELRQKCDKEIALLRQQAAEEIERTRLENEVECKGRLTEADKTLADHQNQATEILAHANGEAERLMTDAFAEADRIRLDGETSVVKLRSEADEQIAAKHEEADAYVSTMNKEGDDYVETRRAEADNFYTKRHQEAEDYVAARQGEVFKDAEEAQEARDQAFAEVSEARAQVSELLEQARAQSEFIRQEAEEVIRAKVRANIDQAERRLSRLRLTEQASRERILAAQRELQGAIIRLDNEPTAELGDGTDDSVLSEAQQRVIESGQTFDAEASITAISNADYGSGNAVPNPQDEAGVTNKTDIELDEDSSDSGKNLVNQPETIDLTDETVSDHKAVAVKNELGSDVTHDTTAPSDLPGLSTTPPMPPPQDISQTTDSSKLQTDLEPTEKTASKKPTNVAKPLDDEVNQILAEPPIEPQDEDALSRLVQEAMKRAVESAKGGSESHS